MSYQNWSEEFEPVKITLKQDEFVCKKIDKELKVWSINYLTELSSLAYTKKTKDKCEKLLSLIESMETLEKKGE